jgi:hypothetical protein
MPDVLSVDGMQWRAKAYPSGTQVSGLVFTALLMCVQNGHGTHLSVFLELIGSVHAPSTQTYA